MTVLTAIGVLTFLLASLLIFASRKLHVEEDLRLDIVEEMLPHNNCGACGYPSCRLFAIPLVLNASIFVYNAANKTYVKNPLGSPYKDQVKAAEKCTARINHLGLPKDYSAKDIDKWIKREEKFN